jgi:hypothetical protein
MKHKHETFKEEEAKKETDDKEMLDSDDFSD